MSSLLVVDDEASVRSLLSRWGEAGGYSVAEAASAEDALDEMASDPAAVAICDIRMPDRDGVWLAQQLHQQFPDTAVIMATGAQEPDEVDWTVRADAIEYLFKPFGREQFTRAVAQGIKWHREQATTREWRQSLETDLQQRQAQLIDAFTESDSASTNAIDTILRIVSSRDAALHEHSQRVARIANDLVAAMDVAEAELSDIKCAALLHDVGKIAIPPAILHKPAPLDHHERALVRQHPAIGHRLLSCTRSLRTAAEIVLSSHEFFDGRGYPRGLAGEAIPLGSRIIAVADAYDSMTHTRVYRNALPPSQVVHELLRARGSQFDPAVVDAMLSLLSVSSVGIGWHRTTSP